VEGRSRSGDAFSLGGKEGVLIFSRVTVVDDCGGL
jgi:hypothetical protein